MKRLLASCLVPQFMTLHMLLFSRLANERSTTVQYTYTVNRLEDMHECFYVLSRVRLARWYLSTQFDGDMGPAGDIGPVPHTTYHKRLSKHLSNTTKLSSIQSSTVPVSHHHHHRHRPLLTVMRYVSNGVIFTTPGRALTVLDNYLLQQSCLTVIENSIKY